MDVESPAQGSEKDDDLQKSAVSAVSVGAKMASSFRHHLPQIPMMNVGHKIAQSKASARQEVICTAATQPTETAKIHIEGSNKIVEISGTGRREEIFTPPETESSSNSSPGEEAKTSNKNGGSAMDRYGDMTGTPIKLRIRRANRDGELDLSSCIDEAPPQNTSANTSLNVSSSSSLFGTSGAPGGTPGDLHRSGTKAKGKRSKKKGLIGAVTPRLTPPVKKSEDAKDRLPKWLVGDLVWSKVSGHPWWPCMISYDPFEKIYTKLRLGKSYIRSYHVQFFGDEAERGWVGESATLVFEGKKQLEDYFKGMQLKVQPKQRALYKLEVSSRRKKAWEVAWKAAEEALPFTRMERKQKYTFSYATQSSPQADEGKDTPVASSDKPAEEDTGTGRTKTKAKLKKALITARTSRMQGQGGNGTPVGSSEDSPVNGVSVSKRGRKRKLSRYAEQESDEEEPEESTARRKQRKLDTSVEGGGESGRKSYRSTSVKCDGSFEVFRQKHRESVLSENPEFDDETLTDYMQQQWDMMDPKQKSRYRSKFASCSDGSPAKREAAATAEDPNKEKNVMKRSGRVSKPSMKKLEAEEDGKLLPTITRRRSSKSFVEEEEQEEKEEEGEEEISPEMTDALAGVDDVIDSVAAGAGTMPAVKKSRPVETEPAPKSDKRKSKKVEDIADTEQDSDAVSETLSEPGGRPTIQKPVEGSLDLEIFKLSSAGPPKKESICLMCENVGELVQCEGPCGGSFHTDCLGLTKSKNSTFKCDECSSGVHSCFSCKEASADTKRCSVSQCGRYYHEECVKKYHLTRQENRGFVCPLHSCATCAADNPKSIKATKGRLFRCVRCPVAYHLGDFCIAAGSIPLAGYNIVCSRHFQPIKTQKHHSHVNVSWCFICNKGGTLLCCESCPAAFHEPCLKIEQPEGNWYCRDCTLGKRPLYGDVIWVKLGNYRWWPGEICHPKNVPRNIQEKSHQVGEFPVKFLGSNDYFWIHQGRVFLFQEGDKGTKDMSSAKGLAKVFAKAVKEGTQAFKLWKDAKENKAHQEVVKNDKKPAPYKHIKTNIPCGNVQLNKPDPTQLPRCDCKINQENPCGPDSECFNRMLLFECHPNLCPAGDKCQNQRFQKRLYPECEVYRTASRGWGLRTVVDVKKGEFVNEYVGELVDEEECRKRIKKAHEENITNFYMLTIDKNRIIDAGPKGNYSRFMNHSCQPNLDTQKWTINGEVRVGLFASHDIAAGTELMFNYNLDCLGNEKTACSCGAPICSGFLGVRPKTSAAVANEKRAKEIKKKKKRKSKVDIKKEHEDDCFRCGEGGELVMCDKKSCPKVYHLQCLNLAKPPHGKWTCPWHHCDQCGKLAVQLCSECPNSFCHDHLEGKIFETSEGKLICSDHEDLLSTLTVTKVDPFKVKVEPVDKDSLSGESPVTDSDSMVSSEESEKRPEDIAEGEVRGKKSLGRKSERGQVAGGSESSQGGQSAEPETSDAASKTSRTGRKIKKRTYDYLDANGVPPEGKPKRLKVTATKKKKFKTKTDSSSSASLDGVAELFSEDNSVKAPPQVAAVKDEPMFDDSDEEGFGGLVIDIPAV